MKPRLFDLFCGGGGAAMGYSRAGFDVVGVDDKPQKHYPFAFILGDALDAVEKLLVGLYLNDTEGRYYTFDDFNAIHASPPCQRYSNMTKKWKRQLSHPDLVAPTREALRTTGRPYVIENVPGSPLLNPVVLCGSMFGLHSGGYQLRRHRLFETSSFNVWAPASCCHTGQSLPVYGHAGGASKRDGLVFPGTAAWKEGMGIDWMTGNELAEAIPPAYTEYIGKYLMAEVLRQKPNSLQGVLE